MDLFSTNRMKITPVIMSGGTGSRLWPQSRALYPKQFLPLVNNKTMLQNTLERVLDRESYNNAIVVANEEHRFIVAEQSRQIAASLNAIILEPVGRNTAPAVAVAAFHATHSLANEEDTLLLVLAADHVIADLGAFQSAVQLARTGAQANKLVTFGIVPTHPETGYGYIKTSRMQVLQPVEQFVEKPDQATAEQYLAAGDYFWNSGMFLFSARRYLDELNKFQPEIYRCCQQAYQQATRDMDFIRLDSALFSQCPDDSIDYAIMEKTQDAVMVPLAANWSDVGSWSALWEIVDKDKDDNALIGDVLIHNVSNCYIRSEKKLIAGIGLENLVITESDDAILIAHKDRSQDVKEIVGQLKAQRRAEAKRHRKVYRPWGYHDVIDGGERFLVKRITVNPGETITKQMHHHRAEHWIVVQGTAKVTQGDKTFLLTENQSTYIPIGEVHALENPGLLPLHLIEVHTGSYLGEDDITRFKNDINRIKNSSPAELILQN